MATPNKSDHELKSAGHHFKIALVILIFLMTIFKLSLLYYYPATEIISDKLLLGIILAVLGYLWIQTLHDRHYLVKVHRKLQAAYTELQQAQIDTISALIKAVEARDAYTRGHSERVTKVALEIAKAMELDQQTVETIERAGKLHDVGKIGISDAVLLKKEKLTDEDWQIIREHPQKGADILKTLKFLAKETSIILRHHERLDGKGYPAGVKAPEIPLESLIIAVADSFDAMNTRRPYREPMSKAEIIAELKKASGIQLSPRVVEIFLKLLEKKPELWEEK